MFVTDLACITFARQPAKQEIGRKKDNACNEFPSEKYEKIAVTACLNIKQPGKNAELKKDKKLADFDTASIKR